MEIQMTDTTVPRPALPKQCELRERVGHLASALAGMGVRPGDTVGVLDWDSNRFLEAFFAVPMMGAVLQTVNVRLPPERVALHDQPRQLIGASG
jgi:acyl-CoA synthetase (AMP-forming)/AMP-acid ligase II